MTRPTSPKLRSLMAVGAVSPAMVRRLKRALDRGGGRCAPEQGPSPWPYAIEIETEHLRIRPFRETDATALAEYRSDKRTAALQSWVVPYPCEAALRWIRRLDVTYPGTPGTEFHYAVEHLEDGGLVGDIALFFDRDPRLVECGITLNPAYRRGRYAVEIARAMMDHLFLDPGGVHRIVARTNAANRPSIALATSILGWRHEGRHPSSTWFKGGWSDVHTLAVLADEWRAARRGTSDVADEDLHPTDARQDTDHRESPAETTGSSPTARELALRLVPEPADDRLGSTHTDIATNG